VSSEDLPARSAPFKVKLAAAMRRAGYSQRRLALELGTDRSLIAKYLNGTIENPSLARQGQLARILDTPPDYFAGRTAGDRLTELEARVERLEKRRR
jgi:transcriptional regulator with XRE-family HTH domain